jgi:protein-S-isoprenylcysteine O-methyltransferase Ste14
MLILLREHSLSESAARKVIEMPSGFWNVPLFWVGLYLVGFVGAMVVYHIPMLKSELLRVADSLRTMVLIPFLGPPFALPLVPQPRLAWPTFIGWLMGVPLLVLAAVVGLLAQREIGLRPSWGQPRGLVTTGIYRVMRHPIYLSVILFAAGWAIGFRAIYALLFVPALAASYVAMTFVEEQGLRADYGDVYKGYAEKVPWRLIPGVF